MRSLRTLETTMLGYPIESVAERDHLGITNIIHFEVLCPRTGAVLGSFANRKDAQWFVLLREMRDMNKRAKTDAHDRAA